MSPDDLDSRSFFSIFLRRLEMANEESVDPRDAPEVLAGRVQKI